MDADTKRWLAHFDEKLDVALTAQTEFRERIVRLEEHRITTDREIVQNRSGIEAAATCIRKVDRNLVGCQAIRSKQRAKLAGMAAGIGAVVPVLLWLASKAFGF